MSQESLSLDTTLLRGFRYACQPGCGLCCFAEPRVEAGERGPLLQIAPAAQLRDHGTVAFLRARPDGGACGLLEDVRCTAHAARPHPCREFPVHVHLGSRLQATLVLSCPGIDLRSLADLRPYAGRSPPLGFEPELESIRSRVVPSVARRLTEAERRRGRIVRTLERQGRWVDEDRARAELRQQFPHVLAEDFPAEDPPSAEEGLERLPLYFDGRAGPVALAAGLGGWEALELRPAGGVERHLGQVPAPTKPPQLDPGAERLLTGYLRYFLERDLFFASLIPRMIEVDEGTVTEWAEGELRAIGATVLSRASVRAKLAGAPGDPLAATEVEAGIRATDQDLLDVRTWGDRL